jgi:hypothetical protein
MLARMKNEGLLKFTKTSEYYRISRFLNRKMIEVDIAIRKWLIVTENDKYLKQTQFCHGTNSDIESIYFGIE